MLCPLFFRNLEDFRMNIILYLVNFQAKIYNTIFNLYFQVNFTCLIVIFTLDKYNTIFSFFYRFT